jgi:hypothetical protein
MAGAKKEKSDQKTEDGQMTTQTNIGRKLAVLTAMGSLLLSFTTLALAESDAVRAIYLSAANVPTNLANIHTYAEPPKGFNPLTATDVELATYGFPQRPDKQADPDHYALWERAMTAAKIRWHGDLKPAPSSRRGMMPAGSSPAPQAVQSQTGPQHLSNISGSGVILNNGVKKWSSTASFSDIWTEISVPVSQLPFDNTTGCTAPDYFSMSLAGIDGEILYGANGVPFFLPEENAGVLSAVNCSNSAVYYAYVGWEEGWSSVFQVNPGDIFYTELHAFGGCNNGSAYVEDLTTLTYNSYTISNPCDRTQIGRFANWIVWRPCCDGPGPDGAWPLANTIGISFEGATVLNGSDKPFYPGSQAASTEILTMTDDAGHQSIEVVSQGSTGFQGQHSLFLQTTGCAYTGGCTP